MGTDYAETNAGFVWHHSVLGGPPQVIERYCLISQTLKCGQVVGCTYTGGSVRAAAEADTSLFGVMTHNLTTTATEAKTMAEVIPFLPGYVWEVKAAAGMAGGSPIRYLGHWVDLEIQTTNRCRVDTGATTNLFQVVGYNPADDGRTNAGNRLWVMLRDGKSQMGGMLPPGIA